LSLKAVPVAASIEGDTETPFLAPNDTASPLYLLAVDRQREAVRDVKWGEHFKRSAGLREIPNSAFKWAAADLNKSGLKDAPPWRCPFLFLFQRRLTRSAKSAYELVAMLV
jgi:hypothetical protein